MMESGVLIFSCNCLRLYLYLYNIYIYILYIYIYIWYHAIVSLTLREEHRLRVFENRVLRRIFGPKRDEVTAEWRKLHTKELRDLYSSPSIIRIIKSWRISWASHVARMGRRETRIDY
jgi:hypothetical protein